MINKDEVLWYPMRVTYSREIKMKESLDKLGIENFIPMKYEIVDNQRQYVPAIKNLIFIHTDYTTLSKLKRENKDFHPLRYYMHNVTEKDVNDKPYTHREVMFIPNREMDNFIRVSLKCADERVEYIKNLHFACKPGAKVLISDGPFAGIKGTVKHVRKNLSVVVALKGIAALVVTQIPKKSLVYLTDDEY
ncbi:MAG: UpxY family transcription antiterminator [Bacteroidales bacterium]|nr:UpxY family transcription antiterminator [Bacteroidales bacterium]